MGTRRFVTPARVVEPSGATPRLDEAYGAYRELHARLKDFYPRLARFGG
jgi:hypothetical protein